MNTTDKIMALAKEFSAAACHVAHYDADRTTILPRSDAVQLLKQKHDTLRTEIEALVRDAERYRWARLRYDGEDSVDLKFVPDPYWGPRNGNDLDAAIDTAMQEKQS